MRNLICTLAMFVALVPGVASADTRDLLVLNAGDEAIFSVRVGQATTGTWSSDLLAFNDVIGVSAGKTIRVTYDSFTCSYDVQVTLADGKVLVIPQVNLCGVDRLTVSGAP